MADHRLYLHPVQGKGRWDNPALYLTRYMATRPEAAVGESFADLSTRSPSMLAVPSLPGSVRRLGTYRLDETTNPRLSPNTWPGFRTPASNALGVMRLSTT